MRKAMVVRAGSAMGGALVEKLVGQGIETVTLVRSSRKFNKMKKAYSEASNPQIVQGDVYDVEVLTKAAEGVDVIFCGTYLTYNDKPEEVSHLMQAVMQAAENIGAKVVLIKGVYHTQAGTAAKSDTTMKSAVPILRIHSPELYGATAKNTIIHHSLKNIAKAKPVKVIGSPNTDREYVYLPNAANRIIDLALQELAYDKTWNIGSGALISMEELSTIAGSAIGLMPRLESISRWKLRFLGRFERRIKEFLNHYETTTRKGPNYGLAYEGREPITSYELGIMETMRRMKR